MTKTLADYGTAVEEARLAHLNAVMALYRDQVTPISKRADAIKATLDTLIAAVRAEELQKYEEAYLAEQVLIASMRRSAAKK